MEEGFASQQQAAANGNGHSLAEAKHEEGSGEDAPQEEAGEETEISDYDEHTHDGEPASSGGAGTGSGLRPSYGRKVCSPSSDHPSTDRTQMLSLLPQVLGQCLDAVLQSPLRLCHTSWAAA